MSVNQTTQVLIVGAGPVGLALAIELGQRGVPCLLIERNERGGFAPRAKTTHVRTREHLRRWGIAGKLREASPLGVHYPSNVLFVTRLAGHELTRFENAFHCAPGRNPLYSEHAQWIPQYSVEEVLRAHVQTLASVQVRMSCELLSISQDEGGVQATVKNALEHGTESIKAAFVVGCDGARSAVRDLIGVPMQGQRALSSNYNIVFRAPGLAQAHKHGPAVMYWQVNGDAPSLIGPMDVGDKWFFMPTKVSPEMQRGQIDARALIAKATGIDLPYEVLSTDEWTASQLIAERYRQGRIFLAGDACHVNPPFGGYGMNLGISDSVDLGWKLAAVLQGWGGSGLLASYETERRPVHDLVVGEAVANHATLGNQLVAPGMEENSREGEQLRAQIGQRIQAAKLREFATLGVVLGYHYEGSPCVLAQGDDAAHTPPATDFINYVPSSRPGHLAPHAWLHDGSSLYDHFGAGFTLLATPTAQADHIARAQSDAARRGIPLTLVQPRFGALAALYPQALTLIRPDQHVAWRSDVWPESGETLFHRVSGRV